MLRPANAGGELQEPSATAMTLIIGSPAHVVPCQTVMEPWPEDWHDAMKLKPFSAKHTSVGAKLTVKPGDVMADGHRGPLTEKHNQTS